jgi:DNA-binding response OmpR family regulator
MNEDYTPVVLVVDDERGLADLFTAWLGDEYAVETAYSGEEALDALDVAPDVVLLDRRMPGLSGDEVLEAVRERDLDCRVSMVTAVEPDFDIVEMGFDAYLTKPVSREEMQDLVETLLARKTHDDAIQEYFRLVTKRAALDAQYGEDAPEDDRYEELQAEIDEVEQEVDRLAGQFDGDDFQAELQRIERDADDDVRDTSTDGGVV